MPVGRVNGIELYWEQRGGGPRLLLCNGSGLALQDVRPLLDPLASSFELLAWDYRGFGRSAPVTRPYTMADVAADAAGLLEVTGWESCRVVGASFGGMVAQEFAVTYPQRVERLALACTSAGGEGGSSYPQQKLLELPSGQRVAGGAEVGGQPLGPAMAGGPPRRSGDCRGDDRRRARSAGLGRRGRLRGPAPGARRP